MTLQHSLDEIEDKIYDVCVIGSGAGAGPIIYELSLAGYEVIVLEKGPWFRTIDFTKDEITATRRSVYTPNLKEEPQVFEEKDNNGKWVAQNGYDLGRDFWNGNCVGGSSNFMSGFFLRMKPDDFRQKTKFGAHGNTVDWPISYDDLEPYYTKVEKIVGVSGKNIKHKFSEKRSEPDFPYLPLNENKLASIIDNACKILNIESIPTPRAILSKPKNDRNSCYYSNYCGSFGCSSDAKGSSRVSLIHDALKTGKCTVIPNAKVFKLDTDDTEKIQKVFIHHINTDKAIKAKIFVLAAQAIESSRLLLMSKSDKFPHGLSNNNKQVGKNLIFSAGGIGEGELHKDDWSKEDFDQFKTPGLFVNRSIQYYYEFKNSIGKLVKGGTIDFIPEHANPIAKAVRLKYDNESNLILGSELKQKLKHYFTSIVKLKFEIFVDWTPNDDCFVTLSEHVKDKWGDPVAQIRINQLDEDADKSRFLAEKAVMILKEIGAKNISYKIDASASSNLQVGGCRFGNDPSRSVLNSDCKSHEVDNLYITDGSFMPTGGSVTPTWTIYANSFRVADIIKERLKNNIKQG